MLNMRFASAVSSASLLAFVSGIYSTLLRTDNARLSASVLVSASPLLLKRSTDWGLL